VSRPPGERPKYTVQFRASAKKDIAALPTDVTLGVTKKIDALADDPRPNGCQKIKGVEDTYRLRSGDYRIVYEIHDDVVSVTVIRVGHRREVYR
jgi:mRNA interferase RelE/StbE